MRIVYLCTNPGLDFERMLGPKIHIQAILRGLRAKGHKPILVAVQKTGNLKGYEEFETIVVVHRYLRGFVHRVIPPTGVVDSLQVCWQILKLNRKYPLTLIHERYTGISWGGLLAAKILRLPYILQMVGPGIEEKTIQNNPLSSFRRWLALFNQKILLQNCQHLILNSKLIAEFIYRMRGWHLPTYDVILNGAEIPEPFTPEQKINLRNRLAAFNRLLFLYSGSLYRWYGTLELIHAFHLALQTNPNLKLLLIGGGDIDTEVERYILNHQIQDSIVFMGSLPHQELQQIIQVVDYCLVYYSGEPTYFGSSTKCIEYMAAGKPVISTPHMLEIIEDGITGFMSKTSSPEDFAAKITEVLSNPEQARIVGENAHQKIVSGFLWEHYIQKLIAIYQSVIDKK